MGITNFTIGSTNKIKKLHSEMKHFVGVIFGYDIDGILVTDFSKLGDFENSSDDVSNMSLILSKIKNIYNIDVSEMKDKSIVDIVAWMKKEGVWKK